jgi:hypothetical protein
MGLADGREIEFVLRIVRMNEIVGNLVCQREIPREMTSTGGLTEKRWEHKPGDQGLAVIALLDITVV